LEMFRILGLKPREPFSGESQEKKQEAALV